MRFKKYINEASYLWQDIPKTFRVVFEVNKYDESEMISVIRQLGNMKLEGMEGISGSGQIVFNWLGVARDAMLVMNGQEVIDLNKMSRFMYGNPNYFLSNNMKYAKRLFSKSGSVTGDNNILHNILEYLFGVLGKTGKIDKSLIEYCAAYQSYAHVAYKKNTGISSTKDLIKWIRKAGEVLKKEDEEKEWKNWHLMQVVEAMSKLSNSDIESAIYKAFERIGEIYGDEAEWDTKANYLKVPKGSYLYILVDKKEYEKAKKMQKDEPVKFKGLGQQRRLETIQKYENIEKVFKQYGIFKKYKVKFIDRSEWDRVRNIHFSKK